MGDGPERVRGANWAAGGVPSLDLGGVGAGRGMSPGLGERSHPHPSHTCPLHTALAVEMQTLSGTQGLELYPGPATLAKRKS